MTQPSVIRLEKAVFDKDYETACSELLSILGELDKQFGHCFTIECDYPAQLEFMGNEKTVHFCQRVANAVTELFHAKNDFGVSRLGFGRFMTLHRWLDLVFASSTFVNADHIIRTYHIGAPEEASTNLQIANNENTWLKFCILYTMESNIPLTLDVLWDFDKHICASLCFALQSPRFIGTQGAFSKRQAILQWFAPKLAEFENLNELPSAIAHDVYMHCSYDITPDKHRVKESLNQVIRRHLLALGQTDRDVSKIGKTNGKPVMLVLLEHFHSAHSIYRTHSTSMIAAREHFHLVGIGGSAVDEKGRQVFDEFVELGNNSILDKIIDIKALADKFEPAVLYMPSIGMDLTPIFLSNLRIAPIQSIALGHPATTHSPFIDYVVVEDDYVGSEACFSEKLIRLPKDALPYVPSALAPSSVEYRMRENPEVVKIGVAATTMKLNPYFLKACQAIRNQANVPVHFVFALGQSQGITHPYVTRFIKSYLGDDATVYPHKPYHEYLQILHQCDMMINPFPFGNTNGIIDMITLGLVGVCKTGDEVHEHIDEGLFDRLGLPKDKLVAKTADEYVAKAVALAENHAERLALRRHVIENNGLQTLFTGNPQHMGEAFLAKVVELGLSDEKADSKADDKPKKEPAKRTTKTATKKATTKKVAKKSTKKD
ncbi:UDP-glucose:protein N-beta-glucosyltransferase [Moraxella oblonga]|uniref:UDP-glucose:protein N-beta-glucosyltransferase n=1 Tax=Moraxella oblonga TaxID=200413 RepID=UPI00082DF2EB|nr:adhesin [Moraxella oblonga]